MNAGKYVQEQLKVINQKLEDVYNERAMMIRSFLTSYPEAQMNTSENYELKYLIEDAVYNMYMVDFDKMKVLFVPVKNGNFKEISFKKFDEIYKYNKKLNFTGVDNDAEDSVEF